MNTESLTKFWPLIYSIVREIWEITEPQIEDAAVRQDIPIELYYYSELGMEYFSIQEFQKRDPFTNPEQFEKTFVRFDVKGWIIPMPDERYQVSREAQEAVRQIVSAGDRLLAKFDLMPENDLKRLANILMGLKTANLESPEPPEKWAIINRFRLADENSILVARIRELLMDLFAYRDDSYLSASHPHFGQAGIIWNVLGSIITGNAVNAGQMTERMSLRGYEERDYEIAIQAAVEIGWVEADDTPDAFRPTAKGREIREQVEQLTDEYFYRPWLVLTAEELDELYALLTNFHEQLIVFKKMSLGESHL